MLLIHFWNAQEDIIYFDNQRFQLDYILVKEHYRNEIKWSYLITDVDSEHKPLIAKWKIALKKFNYILSKDNIEKSWEVVKW